MRFVLIAGSLLLVPALLPAQDRSPPILRDVVLEQHLDEQVPLWITFLDETGQSVNLGKYFTGQPVILVLAYYRCPMLCNQVLNGLVDSLRQVPFTSGVQF